nr:unnamed protein product [Callosobruchus chinensis]
MKNDSYPPESDSTSHAATILHSKLEYCSHIYRAAARVALRPETNNLTGNLAGFKQNLTEELLTYYNECYSPRPFAHFAVMYETIEKSIGEEDVEAIYSLVSVNTERLQSVLDDKAVIDWKICASDAHNKVTSFEFLKHARYEDLREWHCITSLVSKYFNSDGAHMPSFWDYSEYYAQPFAHFAVMYDTIGVEPNRNPDYGIGQEDLEAIKDRVDGSKEPEKMKSILDKAAVREWKICASNAHYKVTAIEFWGQTRDEDRREWHCITYFAGFKRNLTEELLTYYSECYSPRPFAHFAVMYETIGVEPEYNPEKGIGEEDVEAINSLVRVNTQRLRSVLDDKAVIDWKICASDAHNKVTSSEFLKHVRYEDLREWHCITSLVSKYFNSDGAHPPSFWDYSECYAQCEEFGSKPKTGYKRNLTGELLTYYEECYSPRPFAHFAVMYDTLGVEPNYNPDGGINPEDAEAIKDRVDGSPEPEKMKSILSDGAVTDWKNCASDIHNKVTLVEFLGQTRHEDRREWHCITYFVYKFFTTKGAHPPTFWDYSECYAQCEYFGVGLNAFRSHRKIPFAAKVLMKRWL